MELSVGDTLEGKVKSITNFGAFISLPENKTGMVHISEVANSYVSDIRQHLTEGQDVKVMVIGNENGKINLSMKRLEPKPQRDGGQRREGSPRGGNGGSFRSGNSGQRRDSGSARPAQASRTPAPPAAPKTADQIFEEKLKAFMTESDSKLSSLKTYNEGPRRRRRG